MSEAASLVGWKSMNCVSAAVDGDIGTPLCAPAGWPRHFLHIEVYNRERGVQGVLIDFCLGLPDCRKSLMGLGL